jgi:hypothetical protein
LLKYGLYYNIVTCTLAYVLMIILGWRIHRFIRLNLRGSTTDKQKQRTLDIQRQLTRVLIIQACVINLMLIIGLNSKWFFELINRGYWPTN